MAYRGTRGVAVVALIASALVSGWATAKRPVHLIPAVQTGSVFDEQAVKRAGFVAGKERATSAAVANRRFFKRLSDGATLVVAWESMTEAEAKSRWKGKLSLMAAIPRESYVEGYPRLTSFNKGEGIGSIRARGKRSIVYVQVHYARTPRKEGYRWILTHAERDKKLVTSLANAMLKNLEASASR
jgi:hypothetical protein